MANAKEIRTKIKSIRNTQKVTKALEMVSASKIRRAQDAMQSTRPYAKRIREVISHMAKGQLEYQHDYLEDRPTKNVGIVIISTDRSLCGGLNINLFRKIVNQMETWSNDNVSARVALVGQKAESFFRQMGAKIIATADHLGEKPRVKQLIGAVKVMFDQYTDKKIDHIYLAYNEFVNTITQKPVLEQLLPLPATEEEEYNSLWDYIYEPSSQNLLNQLIERHIESQVYQAVVENVACEHAARMVAMKAASDNAGELIGEFQLAYNKARQAAITQELSEIVGGAAAV